MSSNLLTIAAEVLEKTAAYVEALEGAKQSAAQADRQKVAETLRTRVTELTGETIGDEVVAKLASSDADVISLVEKLAGSTQAPDPMGGPGEDRDVDFVPRTKKEAAEAAEARLVAWLSS